MVPQEARSVLTTKLWIEVRLESHFCSSIGITAPNFSEQYLHQLLIGFFDLLYRFAIGHRLGRGVAAHGALDIGIGFKYFISRCLYTRACDIKRPRLGNSSPREASRQEGQQATARTGGKKQRQAGKRGGDERERPEELEHG